MPVRQTLPEDTADFEAFRSVALEPAPSARWRAERQRYVSGSQPAPGVLPPSRVTNAQL